MLGKINNMMWPQRRRDAIGTGRHLVGLRLRLCVSAANLLCLWLWMVANQSSAGEAPRPEPRMSFLDNGTVKIGADLALGGAITWLSHRDRPANIINSNDLGRQIQMSHYSGPVPFQPAGKQMKPEWKFIGWNPIQTGDVFGHPSRVVDQRNDGRELYVKCIPMHWPLENVPGECVYESWTTLAGPTVTTRFRATNARPDKASYPARNQELPAVYVISDLHRYMTYTGDRPFTGGELTHVLNDFRKPWPWTEQVCTESWAALVGDDDWGIGVASGDICVFHGGLHGPKGNRDPRGGPTTYLAPVRKEIFDHDIVYDYTTVFTLGTLAEIRTRLTALAPREPPRWDFLTSRSHWYVDGGSDAGIPRNGLWTIPCEEGMPSLISPVRCWRAEDGPEIAIEAAWHGPAAPARLRWRCLGDNDFSDERSVPVTIPADGVITRVVLPLAAHPGYQGLITGLRLDPPPGRQPKGRLVLRSVVVQRSR